MFIFIGSEPKYAPSNVMQIIKSITAKQIFKNFPEIRKELWGGEFWSDGGYIGTVGEGVTAEIEFSALSRQCLNRRIGDIMTLAKEAKAWEQDRNKAKVVVRWKFTKANAREKFCRHYIRIKN